MLLLLANNNIKVHAQHFIRLVIYFTKAPFVYIKMC